MMSLRVKDVQVATFKEAELTGNELLALMAYGIVCWCQRQQATALEIGDEVLKEFPFVPQEIAVQAFEAALDVVTDARFVAYCPSTGRYRGTLAGKLIEQIGEGLAAAGGKIATLKFIHLAEYFDEVSQVMAEEIKAKQAKQKQTMEKVKEQLKALIEKETIQ